MMRSRERRVYTADRACQLTGLSELKAKVFALLREDEEFRYAVAGMLGLEEILCRLDRHEEEIVELGGSWSPTGTLFYRKLQKCGDEGLEGRLRVGCLRAPRLRPLRLSRGDGPLRGFVGQRRAR